MKTQETTDMTTTTKPRSIAVGDIQDGADAAAIKVDKHGVYMRPDYFIVWGRLDSYPKLCEWLRHLAEKNWVTTDHLSELIMATEAHFKWPHHYGA
jgi:hypothetical protein